MRQAGKKVGHDVVPPRKGRGKKIKSDRSTYRVEFQNIFPPHLPHFRVIDQRRDTQYLVVVRRLRNLLPLRNPHEKVREHEDSGEVRASHYPRPGEDQDPEERGARAPPALEPGRSLGCHFPSLVYLLWLFPRLCGSRPVYGRGGLPQLRRGVQGNHSIFKKKKKNSHKHQSWLAIFPSMPLCMLLSLKELTQRIQKARRK